MDLRVDNFGSSWVFVGHRGSSCIEKNSFHQKIFLMFNYFGSSWVFVDSARRALSTDHISSRFGGLRGSSWVIARFTNTRQEVCGLKWSSDRQLLASGGNDNRLLVWNQSCINPIQIYTDHTAAVKAIAWSPHQQGLLASGGGTADRYIRFWNTLTAQSLQCIDTGSQVNII